MSDVDRDPQVARLLNDVGATVAGHLTPLGVETVYTTVRQRRRNRAVAAGVLALALLGGPSVGFALANDGGGTRPVGGDPSATAPAESPSASPSPSQSPSPSASTPAAPDGRISLADLEKASLDLPPWRPDRTGCKAGDEEFQGQPAYSDVDHDGAEETAALLWCQGHGEFRVYKVMVFDRDAAGEIVTLGQVFEAPGDGDEGVAIWKVWSVQAAAGGQIRVDVGDYQPCCGTAPDLSQHQWRTYGWNGERFTQTGGPTKFGPNPKITDLKVDAGDVLMKKQADGTWRGKVTITIRNAGPFPAQGVDVNLEGSRLKAAGDGWTGWIGVPDGSDEFYARGLLDGLAPGASRTLTLDFTSTRDPAGTLTIRVGHAMEGDTGERGYPDRNADDNMTKAAIRTA